MPETHQAKKQRPGASVATNTQQLTGSNILGNTSDNPLGSLKGIFKTTNMILTVPVFLVGLLRPTTLDILLQYTSVQFGWNLSKAVILVSEVAAVNMILFLLVVPQVIKFVQAKYRPHPQTIDLAIVRTSLFLLCGGAMLIGLAPSITTLIPGI